MPDSIPIACQKVIEFGRGPQETVFQAPMAFVAGAGGAPIEAVSRRFLKKEGQVFVEGRLILFDHQQIVCSCSDDLLAKIVLGIEN